MISTFDGEDKTIAGDGSSLEMLKNQTLNFDYQNAKKPSSDISQNQNLASFDFKPYKPKVIRTYEESRFGS